MLASLTGFIAIYLTLLGVYTWYVARAVRQGPSDVPEAPSPRPRPETHPDPVLES